MSNKSDICTLSWGVAAVGSVDQSQRWILTAMQKHGSQLVTMLWRILGNEQDVCDAYQQTFLQLAHYECRQKPGNVQGYLFRTASNTAISMLRRKKMARRSLEVIADRTEHVDNGDCGRELDARLLQEKLRDAVSRLPEYLRDVIVLRELAELPYAKVGDILGIREATARVYRSKAITLLAKWLAKEKDE